MCLVRSGATVKVESQGLMGIKGRGRSKVVWLSHERGKAGSEDCSI